MLLKWIQWISWALCFQLSIVNFNSKIEIGWPSCDVEVRLCGDYMKIWDWLGLFTSWRSFKLWILIKFKHINILTKYFFHVRVWDGIFSWKTSQLLDHCPVTLVVEYFISIWPSVSVEASFFAVGEAGFGEMLWRVIFMLLKLSLLTVCIRHLYRLLRIFFSLSPLI